MSQENAKNNPPPKPNLGRPDTTSSGLKIVTVAPGSGTQHQTPPPEEIPEIIELDAGDIPPPPKPEDPYLGCTIDNRYKVEALLGEGGMGMVYQCRHKIIDKKVAMKILRADLARDQEVTERFLIEAKAASSIGNDHIIDISDFGQLPDGSAYFVMEFLEGIPLSDAVPPDQTMPAARIIAVAMQLCDGLAAAHEASIVHRDLKPDNIYLVNRGAQDDYVKILDFGIAKVSTNATGKLTQAGSVFGTPHYMSPEQAAGAPVDHRGDIYSVGVILYELASGRVPFDADNFMGILTQHMYKAPDRLKTTNPHTPEDITPGLEAIILKCLSKRPEQRYDTMGSLRQDLQRLVEGGIPIAVEELMDRSGSFNVPPDFFKRESSSTDDVTASDFRPKRFNWGIWLGVVAPIGAAAGLYLSQNPDLVDELTAGSAVASLPEVEVSSELTVTSATSPTAASAALTQEARKTRPIALGIEPAEAHAFVGDEDLGTNPVLIELPEGETLTIEIRHPGFKTEIIELDGSEAKKSVSLEPAKKRRLQAPKRRETAAAPGETPRPKAASKSKSSSNPQVGGSEIVNPWK